MVSVLGFTPATGQSLVVSPRVALMDGDESAGSAGLRAEVGSPVLAVFGQASYLSISGDCVLLQSGVPPCPIPSGEGLEFLGGVRLALPRLGPVRPAISLGAGAIVWTNPGLSSETGTESAWEAELRFGVKAASWADLLPGGVVKNVGQRAEGGSTGRIAAPSAESWSVS